MFYKCSSVTNCISWNEGLVWLYPGMVENGDCETVFFNPTDAALLAYIRIWEELNFIVHPPCWIYDVACLWNRLTSFFKIGTSSFLWWLKWLRPFSNHRINSSYKIMKEKRDYQNQNTSHTKIIYDTRLFVVVILSSGVSKG